MLRPERVIADLRIGGSLWDAGPGLIGLRGPVLGLLRDIERELEALARLETHDEWRTPPGSLRDTRRSIRLVSAMAVDGVALRGAIAAGGDCHSPLPVRRTGPLWRAGIGRPPACAIKLCAMRSVVALTRQSGARVVGA